MARVTVTDCLAHVDNRFQLVLVASKRARQLILGAEPLVESNRDKPTVLALREIAAGLVGPSILDEKPIVPELSFDNDEEWNEKLNDELISKLSDELENKLDDEPNADADDDADADADADAESLPPRGASLADDADPSTETAAAGEPPLSRR